MNTQRILPFLALLLLLAVAAPALATVTVTVAMPANNATVTSPVNIVASATTNASGASVTGWHIYVDSVDSYANAGPTSSINTNVAMASGDHTVIVRAWYSTGACSTRSPAAVCTTRSPWGSRDRPAAP